MVSPQQGDSRPNNRHERRQQAPSLDVMTAQSSALTNPQTEETDTTLASAMQESRSSSSTNSPAPNDNEESDFFLIANDSQSSLGVLNLQDMQNSEGDVAAATIDDTPDCIPPVNRLPNEILISIFAKLGSSADQLHCMLTCKRWARNTVDLLWHRPACTNWTRHESICQTLGVEAPYFSYKDFIKRLNLASIADKVNDGSVMPLAVCNRIERLTLTGCKRLTDTGLIALVNNSHNLLALDISNDDQITEATIFAIAEHCRRLQGLNVSGCTRISNEGMIKLAESCKYIKRIKLNDCNQLTDEAVLAFAQNCPNILEIDLHQCRLITNQPVTNLLSKGQALRELRLTNCELIDDNAFLSLPTGRTFEHLRILDLTSCTRLTDRAVARIITAAPRLRNLVLAKCRNITDAAVYSIAGLGKNLHYVHLGHCGHITDDAVKKLVHDCNRIRYIDLGCCAHLTDESVTRLATLPKLKRIGLVKCSSITDESVYALAKANQRHRQRRDADGNVIESQYYSHSSLERVHLSYCTNLTIRSIIRLLESCHRLTHLSLTGVPAFLREDLNQFCRNPPPEFTMHQRDVFCVFSGEGVSGLRQHLITQPSYAMYRDRSTITTVSMNRRPPPSMGIETIEDTAPLQQPNFETFTPNDDGSVEDGEMATLYNHGPIAVNGIHPLPLPIPIPGPSLIATSTLVPTAPPFTPATFLHPARFPANTSLQPATLPVDDASLANEEEHGLSLATHSAASTAPIGMSFSENDAQPGPSTASGWGHGHNAAAFGEQQPGPSTASGSTRNHMIASFASVSAAIHAIQAADEASRAPLGAGSLQGTTDQNGDAPSSEGPPAVNDTSDIPSSRSSSPAGP